MHDTDNNKDIKNLSFTWKTKRWFLIVFLFNFLNPFLISLDLIFNSKGIHNHVIIPQMAIFPLILIGSFLSYYWMSKKFYEEYSEVIKPQRKKYFLWGIMLSLVSFCFFAISISISYASNGTNPSWYTICTWILFSINSVLGTASTALITVYEFCISFDIFYSKNKIDIIREYLKRNNDNLKIKDQEIDED